jgi:hypothetical protein
MSAILCLLAPWFLLVSCLAYSSTLEHGVSTSLRNVGELLPDYMTLHPRRQYSSQPYLCHSLRTVLPRCSEMRPIHNTNSSILQYASSKIDSANLAGLTRPEGNISFSTQIYLFARSLSLTHKHMDKNATKIIANPLYIDHSVQTGFGAHSASYPMGTASSFPEINRPGPQADHSPPSNADVKNGGATPPLPHVFMAQCLIN